MQNERPTRKGIWSIHSRFDAASEVGATFGIRFVVHGIQPWINWKDSDIPEMWALCRAIEAGETLVKVHTTSVCKVAVGADRIIVQIRRQTWFKISGSSKIAYLIIPDGINSNFTLSAATREIGRFRRKQFPFVVTSENLLPNHTTSNASTIFRMN
jgi:hypothetical protein